MTAFPLFRRALCVAALVAAALVLAQPAMSQDKAPPPDPDAELVKESLPAALKLLKAKKASVRFHAVGLIGSMEAGGAPAVPELLKLVAAKTDKNPAGEENPNVRIEAIKALSIIRAEPKKVVAACIAAFDDPVFEVRLNAMVAAGSFQGDALDILPSARGWMKSEEPLYRGAAVEALGAMGPSAKALNGDLIERLKDDVPAIRGAAVIALVKVHEDRAKTLPAVVALAADKDAGVRMNVANALGSWEGVDYATTLAALAKDADPVVAAYTVEVQVHLKLVAAPAKK